MTLKRFLPAVLLAFALAPAATLGGTFPVPSVEFSGDNRVESMGMVMDAKVFITKDKQRNEVRSEKSGVNMITIVRLDKGVAWNLMVDQKTFMEVNVAESQKNSGDFRACSVEFSGDASDPVNGVAAKKSHGVVKCPDVEYGGDFWVTPEGIVVRMDVTGKANDGTPVQIKTEMSNLRIGPQDASLFEVPAGYAPMGNMNNMMNNLSRSIELQNKMMEQELKRQEEERKRQEADDEVRRKNEEERLKAEAAAREYSAKKRAEEKKKEGLLDNPEVKDAVKTGVKKLFGW